MDASQVVRHEITIKLVGKTFRKSDDRARESMSQYMSSVVRQEFGVMRRQRVSISYLEGSEGFW